MAIFGGEHCISYDVVASEISDGECVSQSTQYYSSWDRTLHGGTWSHATAVVPHQVVYDNCVEGEFVTYAVKMTAADSHYNYLVEVSDASSTEGHDNPTALSLHLYDHDGATQAATYKAVNGIYSVAVNLHNFAVGDTNFAVKCEGAGERRYSVIVYQVEQILELGHEYHGEVCPGEWVYHSYYVPEGVSGNVRFHMVKHSGDAIVTTRHAYVPVKVVPPFLQLSEYEVQKDLDSCSSPAGETVFLGMKGGKHCASYEISVSNMLPGAPCVE
eukprot:1273951-Prymnesium_polylepis.1